MQTIKSVIDQIPFALMTGAGVGLMMLCLYSMAVVSVVESLKDSVPGKGKKMLTSFYYGRKRAN